MWKLADWPFFSARSFQIIYKSVSKILKKEVKKKRPILWFSANFLKTIFFNEIWKDYLSSRIYIYLIFIIIIIINKYNKIKKKIMKFSGRFRGRFRGRFSNMVVLLGFLGAF